MSQQATPPTELGLRAFARLAGFKPGYASKLKTEGRLVLTDDGKRVLVAESLQLIADTRDPAKQGVVDRHAAARGARVAAPTTEPGPEAAPGGDDGAGDGGAGEGGIEDPTEMSAARRRSLAQATREEYQAKQAQLEYERAIGKLLDADQVREAAADAVTTLRTRLESLPDVLGIEGSQRGKAAEEIEHALAECARAFGSMGRSAP